MERLKAVFSCFFLFDRDCVSENGKREGQINAPSSGQKKPIFQDVKHSSENINSSRLTKHHSQADKTTHNVTKSPEELSSMKVSSGNNGKTSFEVASRIQDPAKPKIDQRHTDVDKFANFSTNPSVRINGVRIDHSNKSEVFTKPRKSIVRSISPTPDYEGKNCAICLQSMAFKPLATLPCMHVLHEECLTGWLLRSAKCPVCLHMFSSDHLINEMSWHQMSCERQDVKNRVRYVKRSKVSDMAVKGGVSATKRDQRHFGDFFPDRPPQVKSKVQQSPNRLAIDTASFTHLSPDPNLEINGVVFNHSNQIDVISRSRPSIVRSVSLSPDYEGKNCAICLQSMAVKSLATLPCIHVMHEECLNSWVHRCPECPVCGKAFSSNDQISQTSSYYLIQEQQSAESCVEIKKSIPQRPIKGDTLHKTRGISESSMKKDAKEDPGKVHEQPSEAKSAMQQSTDRLPAYAAPFEKCSPNPHERMFGAAVGQSEQVEPSSRLNITILNRLSLVRSVSLSLGYEGQNCVICIQPMAIKQLATMPCMHVMHEECLKSWLLRCAQCPVCL